MIVTRVVAIILMVVGVTFGVFGLAAASPLDPLAYTLGARYGHYSAEQRAELARAHGLDHSWWQQCMDWWLSAARGHLGYSRVYRKPVVEVIAERLPWTVVLSAVGLLMMLVVVIVLATWAAWWPGGKVARSMASLGTMVAATPSFVYALAVVAVFGVGLRIIPLGGAAPPGQQPSLSGIGPYLLAPALVLALTQLPWPLLATSEAIREAAVSPAVVSAQHRGLSRLRIVCGHILPVSLLPLVTVLGSRLGELIVGAVIVEAVFTWPGLAQATVEAAVAVDFPILAFVTASTTFLVMLGSLLADIASMVLDPRVTDV